MSLHHICPTQYNYGVTSLQHCTELKVSDNYRIALIVFYFLLDCLKALAFAIYSKALR